MSRAEKFIKDCTRNCSNEIIGGGWNNGEFVQIFNPWLTPDQARRAVEIAKEEMLNEVCEWIDKQKELLEDSFSDPNDFADILKQAMKDE